MHKETQTQAAAGRGAPFLFLAPRRAPPAAEPAAPSPSAQGRIPFSRRRRRRAGANDAVFWQENQPPGLPPSFPGGEERNIPSGRGSLPCPSVPRCPFPGSPSRQGAGTVPPPIAAGGSREGSVPPRRLAGADPSPPPPPPLPPSALSMSLGVLRFVPTPSVPVATVPPPHPSHRGGGHGGGSRSFRAPRRRGLRVASPAPRRWGASPPPAGSWRGAAVAGRGGKRFWGGGCGGVW